MSDDPFSKLPEGIPVAIDNLQSMAEHAQVTFANQWEELLLYPEVYQQLLGEARREADRLLGRWFCRVSALESYVTGDDDTELYSLDDLGSQFIGKLHGVDVHPIHPMPALPYYGEATHALCLVFEPADLVDIFEGEGIAALHDSVAVPLLPRLDTRNVDLAKIWPQAS